MRVVAGTARGINLKTPDGLTTRPTSDRVKEALFSILHFDSPGACVLDLFAGTGQLGIEALSRGAKAAVFIDEAKAQGVELIDCQQATPHMLRLGAEEIPRKDFLPLVRRLCAE